MARRRRKDIGPARPPRAPFSIKQILKEAEHPTEKPEYAVCIRTDFVADDSTRQGMLRADVVDAVHATRVEHQERIGSAGRCTITLTTALMKDCAGTIFMPACDGRMEGCQQACDSLIAAIGELPLDPPTHN